MPLFKLSVDKAGRGARLSLFLALALVGAVVAFYFLYVREKTNYYIDRNLRILSSFSEQLSGAFSQEVNFVRNYARASGPEPEKSKVLVDFDPGDCKTEETFSKDLQLTPGNVDETLRGMPGEETSALGLHEHDGTYWLKVAWAGKVPAPSRPSPRLDKYKPIDPLPPGKGAAYCKQIALDKILAPLLNNERFGAFDAVFLADGKGKVLYSMVPPHAASSLLLPSDSSNEKPRSGAVTMPTLALTDLGSMAELTGWLSRDATPVDPAVLRRASRHTDVEISGDRYLLFTQPYCFRHPSSESDTSADGAGKTAAAKAGVDRKKDDAAADAKWIVGGIVSADRFHADVRSISASKVALAIALCILFICAWPFLRISLLTERQPLTATDVALLAICSVVGVILLTLTLLDALAYERLSTQSNAQLGAFAYRLEDDFTRNVIRATDALDHIKKWSIEHPWTNNNESRYLERAANGNDVEAVRFYDAIEHYPYFTAVSWLDSSGMQQYKVMARDPAPLISLADRQFFKDALQQKTWDATPGRDGREGHPYALEWVQSRTTGRLNAVIAKHTGIAALPVISLSTQLIDVNETVPPPGASFAIIDEQGHVIYHPDAQRIRREDFFAETDFDRQLRGAVLSRSDAYLSTSYWGEDQQMFVHPLRNTPWTLVVFRGKRLLRAINIETLLMTLLALLSNALPYFLLGVLVFTVLPWYRAPFLWPDLTRENAYGRLALVMALAAICLGLSIYAITPEDSAVVIAVLPMQAILSGYILLHRHDRLRRIMWLSLVLWIVTTVMLLGAIAGAHIDTDLLISARPARTRWLLVAVVIFESLIAIKMFAHDEPPKNGEKKPITLEAVLCWSLVTALVGVLVWRAPTPTTLKPSDGDYAIGVRLLCELVLILISVMLFYFVLGSDGAAMRRQRVRQKIAAIFDTSRVRIASIWLLNIAGVCMMTFVISGSPMLKVSVLSSAQAAIATLLLYFNVSRQHARFSDAAEAHRFKEKNFARTAACRVIWAPLALILLGYVTVLTVWLPKEKAWWPESAAPIIFFVVLVATVVLADGRPFIRAAHQLRNMAPPLNYPASYRFAGWLTLLVGAALPAVAYFKLGSRVEQEAIVKFAQLRMARNIESRVNNIASSICSDAKGSPACLGGPPAATAKEDATKYRLPPVWNTLWKLEDHPQPASTARRNIPSELLMPLIPHYSEDSVAMRQLYAKDLADPLWNWPATIDRLGRQQPNGRLLTLDRRVRFEAAASQAFWPDQSRRADGSIDLRHRSLQLTSIIPLLFPSKFSGQSERSYVTLPRILTRLGTPQPGIDWRQYTSVCALLLAFFCGVLYWIVRFVTDRVMLVDVRDPQWIEVNKFAAVGGNVFLVRREKDNLLPATTTASDLACDVSFEQLQLAASWKTSLKDVDTALGRQVRIRDFEYGSDLPDVNLEKLVWLEKIVARVDRTILIVSTVTPAYIIGGAASPKIAQRWEKLLAAFLPLTWEDVELRRRGERKLANAENREQRRQLTIREAFDNVRNWRQWSQTERRRKEMAWLRDETANSFVLRRLARELPPDLTREQILDELRERADGYYQALWSSCSPDEKLLIFNLARHGFVNPKNRRMLRRLIARGLVRRYPNLKLLSETFRLHVLAAGCSEDLPAMARSIESEGVWQTLRVPMFIVVISFLILLFTTQKDLLTLTTGFATAITTGLPMLVNLFGMFTQRRLDSAVKTL